MIQVKLRPGETVDRSLRHLKKKVDREGIMQTLRARRYYLKPSERRKIKQKAALRHRP